MKGTIILAIALISTSLCSNLEATAVDSTLKNNSQNIVCQTGEFKTFKYPGIKSDLTEMCVTCPCSFCRDFEGCNICASGEFKTQFDGQYGDRTYLVCTKCDERCLGGFCTDRKGCTKCWPEYYLTTKVEKGNQYSVCTKSSPSPSIPEDAEKFIFGAILMIILIFVVIPAIVIGLITWCIVSCMRKNRGINNYSSAPNQDVSINYQQPQGYQQPGVYQQPVQGYQPQVYQQPAQGYQPPAPVCY